jgi:hypothetical protein
MTFDRPWFLILVLLPVAWAIYERRRTSRQGGPILKALALMAIALAFAEPRIAVSETIVATAV